MLSCPEREALRDQTLSNLRRVGWSGEVMVEIDQTTYARRQERQEASALQLLRKTRDIAADFLLFLEDDLDFNDHFGHNLELWHPMQQLEAGAHFFGSLYNPTIRARSWDRNHAFFIAEPDAVYGAQAVVLARDTARYLAEHWHEIAGMGDIKMSRLAARLCPLHYHMPSLVQHIGRDSVWGGHYHWASDFDRAWRA